MTHNQCAQFAHAGLGRRKQRGAAGARRWATSSEVGAGIIV